MSLSDDPSYPLTFLYADTSIGYLDDRAKGFGQFTPVSGDAIAMLFTSTRKASF